MMPKVPADLIGGLSVELFGLVLFLVYFSNVVLLNTSVGLRLGYNGYRIMLAAWLWPVMEVYDPLDEWAKGGECTLPEDHPLRSDTQ